MGKQMIKVNVELVRDEVGFHYANINDAQVPILTFDCDASEVEYLTLEVRMVPVNPWEKVPRLVGTSPRLISYDIAKLSEHLFGERSI